MSIYQTSLIKNNFLSYAIKNPIIVVIPNTKNIPPAEKDCAKASKYIKKPNIMIGFSRFL